MFMDAHNVPGTPVALTHPLIGAGQPSAHRPGIQHWRHAGNECCWAVVTTSRHNAQLEAMRSRRDDMDGRRDLTRMRQLHRLEATCDQRIDGRKFGAQAMNHMSACGRTAVNVLTGMTALHDEVIIDAAAFAGGAVTQVSANSVSPREQMRQPPPR